jgi:hypothetical protein
MAAASRFSFSRKRATREIWPESWRRRSRLARSIHTRCRVPWPARQGGRPGRAGAQRRRPPRPRGRRTPPPRARSDRKETRPQWLRDPVRRSSRRAARRGILVLRLQQHLRAAVRGELRGEPAGVTLVAHRGRPLRRAQPCRSPQGLTEQRIGAHQRHVLLRAVVSDDRARQGSEPDPLATRQHDSSRARRGVIEHCPTVIHDAPSCSESSTVGARSLWLHARSPRVPEDRRPSRGQADRRSSRSPGRSCAAGRRGTRASAHLCVAKATSGPVDSSRTSSTHSRRPRHLDGGRPCISRAQQRTPSNWPSQPCSAQSHLSTSMW